MYFNSRMIIEYSESRHPLKGIDRALYDWHEMQYRIEQLEKLLEKTAAEMIMADAPPSEEFMQILNNKLVYPKEENDRYS